MSWLGDLWQVVREPAFVANSAVALVGIVVSVGVSVRVAITTLRRTITSDRELALIQSRAAISVPAARQLGTALSVAGQLSWVDAFYGRAAIPEDALQQLVAQTRLWSAAYDQAQLTVDVDSSVPLVIDSVSVICRMLAEPANRTYLAEAAVGVDAEQLADTGLVYAALLQTLQNPLYGLGRYGTELLRWDGTSDLPKLDARGFGKWEFEPLCRIWFEDRVHYPGGRPVDDSHPKMWMALQLHRFGLAVWDAEKTRNNQAYFNPASWQRGEQLRKYIEPQATDGLPAVKVPPPDSYRRS